eukprot:CAMPEP_0202449734 /NCGR_PEP_ID=MMETSP1360-20130828/8450_1 /ASSEMBLY_ACC=CAM_ASM_000848 /TAXON_ID=515479 /ORGANISM="Licmophora paradoxa, Strain CCMP2313" /LENGTH=360 /DNA_ID=CAMNT_0049067763 /DNA_START=25 /DNA_END=1107 /DNA_ORIENTATION=+
MKFGSIITSLLVVSAGAFVPLPPHSTPTTTSPSSLHAALSEGDMVYLIGPGFLQLVVAKTCKAAGLKPVVVAPQSKLDNFGQLLEDEEILSESTIGMPEVGEPHFGKLAAVVFCAEDAVLPSTYIQRVLDYSDKGESAFVDGSLKKVVMCAPVAGKTTEQKSMGWIPIFNNDKKKDQMWDDLVEAFQKHPTYKGDVGSLVRFGSLLGGSVDGPDCIKELGISEKMYKMSLEQYRDLKERGFDRYKLGAQILEGNAVNTIPPNQEKMEKEALENEDKDVFKVVSGYPEVDRANRHTVAQAIVQSLLREDGSYPKEMTVLSKAVSQFPSDSEWDELFSNPGPANWPDPYSFDIEDYKNIVLE